MDGYKWRKEKKTPTEAVKKEERGGERIKKRCRALGGI